MADEVGVVQRKLGRFPSTCTAITVSMAAASATFPTGGATTRKTMKLKCEGHQAGPK